MAFKEVCKRKIISCTKKDRRFHRRIKEKKAIEEVFNNMSKVPMEVDIPIEEKVTNISESIQGLHVKIMELEGRTTPSTPQEEIDHRE